ncbi:glycosyltransferase [Thalassococcus sp. S3]|uniref:glycosyltransferase n=1 Tax=Thalassococcus sp. S3 TaxID=2017482 RepID=UPI001024056D|nr:glycosyltransferase [Thalassococcus sp. S3]QBF31128.1 glycosyl transferase [Thalassococcus sp. S3]
MVAQISFILPTLNAQPHLPTCLTALMEGLHAGLIRDLVISDGGSCDATLAMADAAGAEIVSGAPGWQAQVRNGIKMARGRWLWIMRPDCILQPGWSETAAAYLRSESTPAFCPVHLRAPGLRPMIWASARNLSAHVSGAPSRDHPLLLRASDVGAKAICPKGAQVMPVRASLSSFRLSPEAASTPSGASVPELTISRKA